MTIPSEFRLNPSTPDFDAILDQFMVQLSSEESWDNVITSGTGQTLLRYISSVGNLGQIAIERATQETILDTARLQTSIFRITRMLGVHIQRRNPSEITVRVTHDPILTHVIPAYTTWSLGNTSLFNREQIVIPSGENYQDVVLYQGQVASETFVSNGLSFQTFALGSADFSISDRDLWAVIDGEIWNRSTRGLWRYNNIGKVFYENTRPDGKVEVIFGNAIYGGIPPSSFNIEMKYVQVDSQIATDIAINTRVTPQGISGVLGVSLSGLSDYQEHLPAEFYKIMSPALFSANERAVTRKDHRALVATYPGVIDNMILGQAEINPGDVRWMNVISVVLLTTSPWTSAQWNQFYRWYKEEVGMSALHLYHKEAEAIPINVSLRVRCFPRSSLVYVENEIQQKITTYFERKLGSLGGEYHDSDMINLALSLKDSEGALIDYVDLINPEENIKCRQHQYIVLSSLTVDVQYSTRGNPKIITTIE